MNARLLDTATCLSVAVSGATVEVRVAAPEPASGPTTAKGKSPTP